MSENNEIDGPMNDDKSNYLYPVSKKGSQKGFIFGSASKNQEMSSSKYLSFTM